jgi:hypothetical protein
MKRLSVLVLGCWVLQVSAVALGQAPTTGAPAPAPAAGAGACAFDQIRVSLEGGPSPFTSVEYAVRQIEGTFIALQAKQYPFNGVYDDRVAAVSAPAASGLFDQLATAGIDRLKDASREAPFALTYEVQYWRHGQAVEFRVTGPELLDDPRYAQVIGAVTRFVESATGGPALFRDIVIEDSELGLVSIQSSPPALVTIDDVPLGRTTPVMNFELAPGPHVALLHCARLGVAKKVKFNVFKGQLTPLKFNIKK